MRLLITITILFSSLLAFAADKVTEVFTLDHQMSEMCKKRITENLRFEKGVSKIDVSLKENTITITYNPQKTDTGKLIEGFKKIGFNACPVIEGTTENPANQGTCGNCKETKPQCPAN